jgi:putative membrane protein
MTTDHPMSRDRAARVRRVRAPHGVALCLVGLLGAMPACDEEGDTPNASSNDGNEVRPGRPISTGTGNGPAASGNTSPSGNAGSTAGSVTGMAGTAGLPYDAGVLPADAGLGGDAGVALAEALRDGQIVYVVDTLNAGEVEQAQSALPRLEDDAVRSFAQLMIEEHQRARETLSAFARQQGIGLEGSDAANLVRARSLRVEREIGDASAGDVDRVYIDSQVAAHADAAGLLDNLIDAADSVALQAELTQLRLNVLGHQQAVIPPGVPAAHRGHGRRSLTLRNPPRAAGRAAQAAGRRRASADAGRQMRWGRLNSTTRRGAARAARR